MTQVYLGRDTRLGRTVAIRVLPPHLTGDADRLAPMEREARALAALNHPNIAVLYGGEETRRLPVSVRDAHRSFNRTVPRRDPSR